MAAAREPQAVCFLRPTRENVARLRRELRDPRFGEYHLCEWKPQQACATWLTVVGGAFYFVKRTERMVMAGAQLKS